MIVEKKRRLFVCYVLISLFILISPVGIYAQDQDSEDISFIKARQLLKKLSPEEKIGQLFLISFDGSSITENSQVYKLISDYHIGGVVLKRENNNFIGPENIIENTKNLTYSLQEISFSDVVPINLTEFEINEEEENQYIPLFITISQEGDLYPYDEIISGITSLPNQMAIGATFEPNAALTVGQILGEELNAMAINMVFGPSLDVLDINFNQTGKELGTRTFGGDPYWVGEMGKAYVKGLHEGGRGKVAVIVKHFPGRGSSDRMPDEEVATVRKSLEQLRLIELAPFFEVTDINILDQEMITDGLLTSHIRYQGLQGNIRATTKPISMDASALNLLMNLEEFFSWREKGGILISDNLGSSAVRKFYDPKGQYFDARQVILNAFLAGNDLLYVDKFISSGDPDSFSSITKTINLFTQKYKEDQTFAEKVDVSVERILALKYRIYPVFSLNEIKLNRYQIDDNSEKKAKIIEIAQKSLSQLEPMTSSLSSLIEPPTTSDQILFFVDTLEGKQCNDCEIQPIFNVNVLQKALLSLYGPDGTNQVLPSRVLSYSYADLIACLDEPFNHLDIEKNISNADWIIAGQLDLNQLRLNSEALKRLISERPDLIRNRKLVVFAFNSPYYFDATDIASFSGYYAAYSKIPEFVSVAMRVLMQEINPTGNSPVSVPGINYDLSSFMSPDSKQIIRLQIDQEKLANLMPDMDIENPIFHIGDTLPIITGLIIDHNGNHVPDGTIVRFSLNRFGDTQSIQQIETITTDGVARLSIPIQNYGRLELTAASEPALDSDILILDIASEEGGFVSAITPTALPTLSENLINKNSPVENEVVNEGTEKYFIMPIFEWFIISMVIWGIGYISQLVIRGLFSTIITTRVMITSIICGYFLYTWMLLELPGSFFRGNINDLFLLIALTILSMALGGLIVSRFLRKK